MASQGNQCQYCGDAVMIDMEEHRQVCRNKESWDSVRLPSIDEKLERSEKQFQEYKQEAQKEFGKRVKHSEIQVKEGLVKKKNNFIVNAVGVLLLALTVGYAINVLVYKPLESMIAKQNNELEMLKTKMSELNNEIKSQLEEIKDEMCGDIPCIPPYELTLTAYEQNLEQIHHPRFYMYTHRRGYMIYLEILPGGWDTGKGSHLSLNIFHVEGQHDNNSHLQKFPANVTVTVELVNQHSDHSHWVREIDCVVTNLTETKNKITIIGYDDQFIPNSELNWNPTRETQYLMNDSLKFRVTKIVREEL